MRMYSSLLVCLFDSSKKTPLLLIQTSQFLLHRHSATSKSGTGFIFARPRLVVEKVSTLHHRCSWWSEGTKLRSKTGFGDKRSVDDDSTCFRSTYWRLLIGSWLNNVTLEGGTIWARPTVSVDVAGSNLTHTPQIDMQVNFWPAWRIYPCSGKLRPCILQFKAHYEWLSQSGMYARNRAPWGLGNHVNHLPSADEVIEVIWREFRDKLLFVLGCLL